MKFEDLKLGKVYQVSIKNEFSEDPENLYFADRIEEREGKPKIYFDFKVFNSFDSRALFVFMGEEQKEFIKFFFKDRFIFDNKIEFFDVFSIKEVKGGRNVKKVKTK